MNTEIYSKVLNNADFFSPQRKFTILKFWTDLKNDVLHKMSTFFYKNYKCISFFSRYVLINLTMASLAKWLKLSSLEGLPDEIGLNIFTVVEGPYPMRSSLKKIQTD